MEFKRYLTAPEFLSGLGLVQAMPGPNFSFASYVGALAMRREDAGVSGQLLVISGGYGRYFSAWHLSYLFSDSLLGPAQAVPGW